MAANLVQEGRIVTLVAPRALSAGDVFIVGGIFGVAQGDAASGASVEADTQGVYRLPTAAGYAGSEGDLVSWNNTAHQGIAPGATHFPIGTQVGIDATGDTVDVKLDGTGTAAA